MKSKFISKTLALFISLMMIVAFSISCFAEQNDKILDQYTEQLSEDISVVVTITESDSLFRASKDFSKTQKYYNSGTYIGKAVIAATFSYNGSTSSATRVGGSGSGANGWSYSGQSTRTSGKSAYLTASLKNGSKTVGVSLSLTCDANGNVS